jgi:hypothetical protein
MYLNPQQASAQMSGLQRHVPILSYGSFIRAIASAILWWSMNVDMTSDSVHLLRNPVGVGGIDCLWAIFRLFLP